MKRNGLHIYETGPGLESLPISEKVDQVDEYITEAKKTLHGTLSES
jgi:hypothetical protein